MVVRNAGEHAGLVEFHVPRELEIVAICPYPGRDAGEAVAARAAHLHTFAVTRGVQKKLRRRNKPGLSAQPVEKVEHPRDLAHGIGGTRLLAVAEGRVRNTHLRCRTRRKEHLVKGGAANARVGEEVAEQARLFCFLKRKGAIAARVVDDAHEGFLRVAAPGPSGTVLFWNPGHISCSPRAVQHHGTPSPAAPRVLSCGPPWDILRAATPVAAAVAGFQRPLGGRRRRPRPAFRTRIPEQS